MYGWNGCGLGLGAVTTPFLGATVYTSASTPVGLSDIASYQFQGDSVQVVDQDTGNVLVTIGPTQDALQALQSAGIPFEDVYQGADYEFNRLYNAAVVGQGESSYDPNQVQALVISEMQQQGWTPAQISLLTGPALTATPGTGIVPGMQMITQPNQVPSGLPPQNPSQSPCTVNYQINQYGQLVCPTSAPGTTANPLEVLTPPGTPLAPYLPAGTPASITGGGGAPVGSTPTVTPLSAPVSPAVPASPVTVPAVTSNGNVAAASINWCFPGDSSAPLIAAVPVCGNTLLIAGAVVGGLLLLGLLK